MLYRAEHAWLVWRCKITLSHQMLQAQLLSPLRFSMENQQPKFQNSRLKCQARADEEPGCICVCFWICVTEEKDYRGEHREATVVLLSLNTASLYKDERDSKSNSSRGARWKKQHMAFSGCMCCITAARTSQSLLLSIVLRLQQASVRQWRDLNEDGTHVRLSTWAVWKGSDEKQRAFYL